MQDKTVTYDGQQHSITVNKLVTQYGDAVTVSYTVTPRGGIAQEGNGKTNVHWYDNDVTYYIVKDEVEGGNNYNALAGISALQARLTINPVAISLSWSNYGELDTNNKAVYDGQNKGKVLTVSGILYKQGVLDEVTLTISVPSGVYADYPFLPNATIQGIVENTSYDFYSSNASGGNTISVSGSVGGADGGNYIVSATSASWTIEKKPITVTGWTGSGQASDWTYEGGVMYVVYSAQPRSVIAQISNIIDGDTVALSYSELKRQPTPL